MSIQSSTCDSYSDNELDDLIDSGVFYLFDGIVYFLLAGCEALLLGSLAVLKNISWDMPKLIVGSAIWLIGSLSFISFLFWANVNPSPEIPYQTSWENFWAMLFLRLG